MPVKQTATTTLVVAVIVLGAAGAVMWGEYGNSWWAWMLLPLVVFL